MALKAMGSIHGAPTALVAGGSPEVLVGLQHIVDFSEFEPGATINVNLVLFAWNGEVLWRVRIGDSPTAPTEGDAVLSQSYTPVSAFPSSDPASLTSSFVNVYTGPKVVKVTGQAMTLMNSGSFKPNFFLLTT